MNNRHYIAQVLFIKWGNTASEHAQYSVITTYLLRNKNLISQKLQLHLILEVYNMYNDSCSHCTYYKL